MEGREGISSGPRVTLPSNSLCPVVNEAAAHMRSRVYPKSKGYVSPLGLFLKLSPIPWSPSQVTPTEHFHPRAFHDSAPQPTTHSPTLWLIIPFFTLHSTKTSRHTIKAPRILEWFKYSLALFSTSFYLHAFPIKLFCSFCSNQTVQKFCLQILSNLSVILRIY